MRIRFLWTDPQTGTAQNRVLETPVAIGRDATQLPLDVQGVQVSTIVLEGDRVSPYHALIQESGGEVLVTDRSGMGVEINGISLPSSTLADTDRLRIGGIELQLRLGATATVRATTEAATTEAATTGAVDLATGCDRQIGFLFKRRCGRTDPTGCPYCDGGRLQAEEPYFYPEYSYYPSYGRYDTWGSDYYARRDYYYYNTETGNVDFTEGDAEAFAREGDADFERDMGAS